MTTLPATSRKESLPIGARSEPETGSLAPVVYREFSPPGPIPLTNTVGLNSLLAEFESDEEMASMLARSRKDLAASLYEDEPNTLSACRLAAGLSQLQLAKLVGTSQPHIARIEGGTTDPGTDLVARIAKALNIEDVAAFAAIRAQIATRGPKNGRS